MPRPTSISISGLTEIIEGGSADYKCTAHYRDGNTRDVTSDTTWSENSNYASFTNPGTLTTLKVPTDTPFEITARYGRRRAKLAVTIKDQVSSSATTAPNSGRPDGYRPHHPHRGSSAD